MQAKAGEVRPRVAVALCGGVGGRSGGIGIPSAAIPLTRSGPQVPGVPHPIKCAVLPSATAESAALCGRASSAAGLPDGTHGPLRRKCSAEEPQGYRHQMLLFNFACSSHMGAETM